MKNYQIVIQSTQNKNVSEIHFFASGLPKNLITDIICPLTKYQLLIKEVDKCPTVILSMEGLLNLITTIKLRTKVAKNVMEVTEGNLGVFYKKPNLNLNIWTGDLGETRTYVNNMNWKDLNSIFPEQFKLDFKSKTPFFQGELYLDLVENKFWQFRYIIKTHKVVYEEITLEY